MVDHGRDPVRTADAAHAAQAWRADRPAHRLVGALDAQALAMSQDALLATLRCHAQGGGVGVVAQWRDEEEAVRLLFYPPDEVQPFILLCFIVALIQTTVGGFQRCACGADHGADIAALELVQAQVERLLAPGVA